MNATGCLLNGVKCRIGGIRHGTNRAAHGFAPLHMTCAKNHRLARWIPRAESKDVVKPEEVEVRDVVALRGIRVSLEKEDPVVEYRVHWKDDAPDTWYGSWEAVGHFLVSSDAKAGCTCLALAINQGL